MISHLECKGNWKNVIGIADERIYFRRSVVWFNWRICLPQYAPIVAVPFVSTFCKDAPPTIWKWFPLYEHFPFRDWKLRPPFYECCLMKYLISYKGLELVSSLNKCAEDKLETCAISYTKHMAKFHFDTTKDSKIAIASVTSNVK